MIELGTTYLEMAEAVAALQRKGVNIKEVRFNGYNWVAVLYQ